MHLPQLTTVVCFLAALLATQHPLTAAQKKLPPPAQRKVNFASDVLPLLQKNCYSCHGPDEQSGGLRLDRRQAAFRGGDSGKTIVPGKSAQSTLVLLVAGLDKRIGLMPPDGEGKPLTRTEVGILRAWIDQGASWPRSIDPQQAARAHWAFQPVRRPPLPQTDPTDWIQNPIDMFILSRLEKEHVTPSVPARKELLIKRLYLDLLGLLPSPPQLQQFLDDNRPGSYLRLVSRVLDSPHYGERWGRHWLDLARYADSDGYEKDRPRPHAWRYRHWVVNALNQDMPFDRFSIQQIAGDMLIPTTPGAQVASGFHRNTLHNTEGGTDREEDRVKKTVDRTNTLGTIWLGLTVGCAQCHSHKYDPLSQQEYYSLYGFLNQIEEQDIAAPLPVEADRHAKNKARFEQAHRPLTAAVTAYEQQGLPAAQLAWESKALQTGFAWTPLKLVSTDSKHGAQFQEQADGSVLATGKNQVSDIYTVVATTTLNRVTAIRLEVLPDKALPKNGPGRAKNGNFVLTTFRVETPTQERSPESSVHKFSEAHADYSQKDWNVSLAINDQAQDGWAVSPQIGKRHIAVFRFAEPINAKDSVRLRVTLDQSYNQTSAHNIGRFRLSVTDHPGPVQLEGLTGDIVAALKTKATKRSPQQRELLAKYYHSIDPTLAALQHKVKEHAKQAPSAPATKAQSVRERNEPRVVRVHLRGNFLTPGDTVSINTPEILPSLTSRSDEPDRLDLARWLFSPTNPLPARVTVNRIWQRYFGRGLVETTDDFGLQGEKPSHPELLDWLASELQSSQWRLKHIHRLIVTSATYRQSAANRQDLWDRDPENRLLARQSRRRVEAEIVRDLALTASGLLDPRIGGVSVKPSQPSRHAGLTYANSAKWQTSGGGDRYRRGLYTFFQRTSPFPMLMTFDAPDSTSCTARRSNSNTPLQALTLWNDAVFFECAQRLARRIVDEVPHDLTETPLSDRIDHGFQLCLSRYPTAVEKSAVANLFNQQRDLCRENPTAARTLLGPTTVPSDTTTEELAGWVLVARTLLNLDEFITKE